MRGGEKMKSLIQQLQKEGSKNVVTTESQPVIVDGNCHCQGTSGGNCGPGVCK